MPAEVDIYDGVGTDLKAARVRKGLDLADIADELRIRRVHLQAIEEGDVDDVSTQVYAVGFVRSYADYLGLDGNAAVQAFKRETSGLNGEKKLVFPFPAPESRVPRVWLIAVSLVVAALIYAGWYYAEMSGRLATDRVPPLPERLAALVPGLSNDRSEADEPVPAGPVEAEESPANEPAMDTPAGAGPAMPEGRSEPQRAARGETRSVAQSSAGLAGAPDTSAPAAPAEPEERPASAVASPPTGTEAPRPGEVRLLEVPAAATAEPAAAAGDGLQVASAGAAPGPGPSERGSRISGEGDRETRMVVRAKTESWVQIMGTDGELLLTRILRPGDRYLVPDREDLFLMTGNAGGLEIVVDGEVVPPIGPPGAVRNNVALVPERLLAGTAVER